LAAKVADTAWKRISMSELRLDVRKTYKLLVNGAFPRSESGRSYEVSSHDGRFTANVAQGSRKDVRDAVVAARNAQPKWWGLSAYNRGQVIYRLAEMAESRRDELAEHVCLSEGLSAKQAQLSVAAAIDRVVWYAGWTDKIAQVFGTANPVAGPYFNFSVPVPSGVVGVLAPQNSSLEGFVDAAFGPIAVGNSVVVLPSETCPIPSILLGEMTTIADFPAGVLNIITGLTGELAPTLSAHEDVDGIDLGGLPSDVADELAAAAAGSIKRVLRGDGDAGMPLRRLRAFMETSTVWHTIGQ
jgi:acyl-CoA reductase-like NAD-dependent aldehyde dehydrogenase